MRQTDFIPFPSLRAKRSNPEIFLPEKKTGLPRTLRVLAMTVDDGMVGGTVGDAQGNGI
jgi:hypothetical protein